MDIKGQNKVNLNKHGLCRKRRPFDSLLSEAIIIFLCGRVAGVTYALRN